MILRGKRPTAWVRGHDQRTLPVDVPAVVDAIRAVLSSNAIYRDTHEDAAHTTFETTVAIPWSILGLPMRVTVADAGGQALAKVAVTSRWWLLTDIYGVCDGHIRASLAAVEREIRCGEDIPRRR